MTFEHDEIIISDDNSIGLDTPVARLLRMVRKINRLKQNVAEHVSHTFRLFDMNPEK